MLYNLSKNSCTISSTKCKKGDPTVRFKGLIPDDSEYKYLFLLFI